MRGDEHKCAVIGHAFLLVGVLVMVAIFGVVLYEVVTPTPERPGIRTGPTISVLGEQSFVAGETYRFPQPLPSFVRDITITWSDSGRYHYLYEAPGCPRTGEVDTFEVTSSFPVAFLPYRIEGICPAFGVSTTFYLTTLATEDDAILLGVTAWY